MKKKHSSNLTAKTTESQTVHPTVYTDRYTQASAHPHKHRPSRSEDTSKICTLPTNFLQRSLFPLACLLSFPALPLLVSPPWCRPFVCPQAATSNPLCRWQQQWPCLYPHLGSPRRLCPRPTARGPGGRAGSRGPRSVAARASRIRATWKAWRDFGASCFSEESARRAAGAQQRRRGAADAVLVSMCECACVCLCA